MNAHTHAAFTLPEGLAIGMPADPPGGSRAYVVEIEQEPEGAPATFTLCAPGAAPMARNRLRIILANESGYLSSPLSEHIAAPMLYRARGGRSISEELAAEIYANAKAAQVERRAALEIARGEAEAAREASRAEIARYRPAWAKAALVAYLMEDKSDGMSDYYASTERRAVVLAWSKHERDLFPEMRKAAALFDATADLATAPDSAEHRQKYSMGGGYFLKAGYRHDSGWKVRKVRADSLAGEVRPLEWTDAAKAGADCNGAPAEATAAPTMRQAIAELTSDGGRFTITEHTHTKKGWQYWLASMAERVERAEYDALLSAARALGGWYARPWAGIPGGFAFKREEAARQFVAEHGGGGDGPGGGERPAEIAADAPAATPATVARCAPAGMGDKLRGLADGLSGKIADCFADRLSNTPKRARQAAEKRNEGRVIERAQAMLRALADLHDAGTVPPILAKFTSRAPVLRLAAEETDRSGGYYDAGVPLGRPYPWGDADDVAEAAALWGLLDTAGNAERDKAAELARKVEALRFAKIEGYFPTPLAVVARMVEAAQLRGHDFERVLEPSAGSGAIADFVRAHGCAVECIERHASLAEVLRLKGHTVAQGDCLELAQPPADPHDGFDAVLMNPPFERGQDCAHLWHAFELVKPGGCVVAIMGAGLAFRQTNPHKATRERIEELGGTIEELPAGTFKESGTGVASLMVTIWKELA